MSKRKTTNEFIRDARKVHGDRYDYSLVKYLNGRTKVKIICGEHGMFEQAPKDHLRGKGCILCGYISTTQKRSNTKEQFIERAIKIYGSRYNYDMVEYKNNRTKVCIICDIHGPFYKDPTSHLRGQGCPECGELEGARKRTFSTQKFIKKVKVVHGNTYDFSNVVYKDTHKDVEVICHKHGKFYRSPVTLLQGRGCPLCRHESLFGESNPNYKDGLSYERQHGRFTPEYRQWVESVKQNKDECEYCGESFEEWNHACAHHMNSWDIFPEQRFDLNNGVAICKSCHTLFHSVYGNGSNTKEQYLQFESLKDVLM